MRVFGRGGCCCGLVEPIRDQNSKPLIGKYPDDIVYRHSWWSGCCTGWKIFYGYRSERKAAALRADIGKSEHKQFHNSRFLCTSILMLCYCILCYSHIFILVIEPMSRVENGLRPAKVHSHSLLPFIGCQVLSI